MAAFRPGLRLVATAVAAFAAAFALAAAARYGLIENTPLGHAREAGEASFRCTVRTAINEGFRTDVPGFLAAAAALWLLWRPSAVPLIATAVLAGLSLQLFNAWPAGLALVLAAFATARPVPA
jgi:hypothetical protein